MINFFKKKKIITECQFCKKSIDKDASFTLEYKASDGIGVMTLCLECSAYMNNMIETWENTHEEND